MGSWLSKLYSRSPAKILMLGLDCAGKTTILYKIKSNGAVRALPTFEFNVETISPLPGVNFTVFDVGGKEKTRRLWKHYYTNIEGLVYVVDSNDKERLEEARDELHGILECEEMKGVPVVVVANKQDLPKAMSPSEVSDGLALPKITNRKWCIIGSRATTGEGIMESMQALADLLK